MRMRDDCRQVDAPAFVISNVFWATLLFLGAVCGRARADDLFVALNGNNAWTGTVPAPNGQKTDGPFTTLERARQEIRELKRAGKLEKGITVHLRGGLYELTAAFTLGPDDSGSDGAPVVYRPYRDEKVVLSGGKVLGDFRLVNEPAVLSRLPEPARDKVWQTDLKAAGVTDFGDVTAAGQRAELFFQEKPMTLARWPNSGFVQIADVSGGQPFASHGIKGDQIGKFTYAGDQPGRWGQEPEIWLHGYWFWDWSDAFQKVKSIDPTQRVIELDQPYHGYGYRPGQRFYALNLLAELDAPGEWYLDRARGLIYFWPPDDLAKGKAVLSVLPTLLALRETSWLAFQGMTLEATRGTAVVMTGGTQNRLAGCVVRNTGSWGVTISGGSKNGVIGCDIYQTGEGGVSLSGGERKTLTAAGHYADNNHLYQFGRVHRTYRPAVGINGVGNRMAHNLIHDGPHNAIQLGGNDHLIEFNEIYDVCYETGDVGAFYMGRDWTARGTVIQHNYFHDISGPGLHGAMAVYLDDAASGIHVLGNLFYRAGRAAFIGGGRDNVIENNIFVECNPSVHVDARGLNWMRDQVEGDGTLPKRLAETPYQQPPWSTRYPKLVNILADEPGAPRGNLVARNVSVGGKWLNLEKAAEPLVTFTNNLVEKELKFVDAANGNFQLPDDSPAYGLGFKKLPLEKIGLYQHEWRASWPVSKSRRAGHP